MLSPIFYHYLSSSKIVDIPSYKEILSYVPTIRSYFFTSKAPIYWIFLSEHATKIIPNWWCHFLFIGIIPWIAILLTPMIFFNIKIDNQSKKFIGFLLLSLFLCIVFCLNVNGYSLYKLISIIPGFSSLRSLNRIINIEIFFFVMILVFLLKILRIQYPVFKYIIYLLPLFVILDNSIYPSEIKTFEKSDSQKQIENIRNEIHSTFNPKSKAILYQPNNALNKVQLQLNVMLACQQLGIPCVNAYTGHYPKYYSEFYEKTDSKVLKNWCNMYNINPDEIQLINEKNELLSSIVLKQKEIHLLAYPDNFVCVDETFQNTLIANRKNAQEIETFTVCYLDSNWVALRSHKNKYVSKLLESNNYLIANADSLDQAEKFYLILLENDLCAFKSSNGFYLCADKSLDGRLIANREYIGDWEKFKMVTRKR